jgi:hypothetical protein
MVRKTIIVMNYLQIRTACQAILTQKVFHVLFYPTQQAMEAPDGTSQYRQIGEELVLDSLGRKSNWEGPTLDHCPHHASAMKRAGNGKMKWWTCKNCGERWRRERQPTFGPNFVPQDHDKILFGPHCGKTYLYLVENEPSYCHYLLQKVEHEEDAPQLVQATARYIINYQRRHEQLLVGQPPIPEDGLVVPMQDETIINSDSSISDPPFN